MHIQFFPLPFLLDLKFYYHFRRQAFEEKIEYPSSLDKKGHLVLTVICEAHFSPHPAVGSPPPLPLLSTLLVEDAGVPRGHGGEDSTALPGAFEAPGRLGAGMG